MAKTGKQNNDLRTVRKETAIVIAASGLFCLLLFMTAVWQSDINPLMCGVFVLVLYAAACAAAVLLLEKRIKGGTGNETLAPVMGRIMFDAVVKMANPVFICDSSERIIWYNSATEQLHSDKNKLYGESVAELFGVSLQEIRADRSEKGARITCEGRSFYAKYNHIKTDDNDFALISTVETTEVDALTEKMAGDELVVCYIIIDNLGEMLQYDSEQYRPAAAKLDEILRDWADEYGGILKEYERDKYLFITEARVLDEMVIRKFDILDRVRSVKAGDTNLPLTISMGVANLHGSYEEKERAAHAALDMALQRGGDQAAVKGETSIEFFGGITKSVQKRTNVRSRVVCNELISAMKNASNVLIMGHRGADFDAFGSAVGLARIAMYCGARVNVVLNMADRNLIGCRELVEPEEDFLGIFIDSSQALDLLETGTLVVVTDVSNFDNMEAQELAKRTEKLAVIDHHRKTKEFEREPDIEYIEPSASSASELVAEMLEQVLPKDDLSPAEANVLLAGITLDTKQFTKNTGTRTFSAAMYLRDRGADPSMVQNLFKQSFDDYQREARFRQNVEIYRGCCAITVMNSGEGSVTDGIIAAKAADNLLGVDGIRASFAAIRIGDAVRISARSNGQLNVELVMKELGGGGHFEGAAAQQNGKSMEEMIDALKKAIDKYLN
ncbi:MAG: DHH family phosphoesterase [Clostridia bacterium]|nr:DHH family phosphoesterase [Clostridia bacterium]MBQ8332771.1 DHH family phosphoesterase [Clostridia bacterium]MBQ8371156.1 DHH family phosphoesterase [Clostridia bacterium]MBQ8512208.1 DHH family phosphoesterase [Clostridia bacterium]